MNPADFTLLTRVLKERSGLALTEEKSYLLESRLVPVARKHSLESVTQLAAALRGRPSPDLIQDVVEAMTTNESFFFRDIKPFDQFRLIVLPHLLKARANTRTIRIWSAACAAGQEPYSIAMILADEQVRLAGWQVELIASDISTEMVERTRAGVYTQFEVQRGLPIRHLVRHFEPDGERWHLKSQIRDRVHTRRINLLDDLSGFGRLDVILCRNVLIYFDHPTKRAILDRLSRLLPQDGYLFLGGAETTLGVSSQFEPLVEQRGLYRPVGIAAVA
jgi:chemotaxis protein methyltransferase CheR